MHFVDHTDCFDAKDMAFWIAKMDPFNAPSYYATILRFEENHGIQRFEQELEAAE